MVNLGYFGVSCSDGDVSVFVFYDAAQPFPQPLINDPGGSGFCCLVRNVSGRKARAVVTDANGVELFNTSINKGDPVTAGPGRSRTAAQLAAAGITNRSQIGTIELQCD